MSDELTQRLKNAAAAEMEGVQLEHPAALAVGEPVTRTTDGAGLIGGRGRLTAILAAAALVVTAGVGAVLVNGGSDSPSLDLASEGGAGGGSGPVAADISKEDVGAAFDTLETIPWRADIVTEGPSIDANNSHQEQIVQSPERWMYVEVLDNGDRLEHLGIDGLGYWRSVVGGSAPDWDEIGSLDETPLDLPRLLRDRFVDDGGVCWESSSANVVIADATCDGTVPPNGEADELHRIEFHLDNGRFSRMSIDATSSGKPQTLTIEYSYDDVPELPDAS